MCSKLDMSKMRQDSRRHLSWFLVIWRSSAIKVVNRLRDQRTLWKLYSHPPPGGAAGLSSLWKNALTVNLGLKFLLGIILILVLKFYNVHVGSVQLTTVIVTGLSFPPVNKWNLTVWERKV